MDGSYKATLVFLHGWCCQSSDFKAQIDFFSKNNFIVAPNYSEIILEGKNTLGQVVVYLYDELSKYKNIIIVGHSMGGFLALKLAQTDLDIKKVIAIDTTLKLRLTPGEKNFLEALDSKYGLEILVDYIDNYVIDKHFDNYDLMQNKTQQMLSYWQRQPKSFNKVLREAFYFDKRSLFFKLNIDFLYIASALPRAPKEELISLFFKTKYDQISTGHFIMLNAVDKTNTLIEEFL
ncbi:hypothetical protein fh0823_13550 [Francisella halioticida]|uniref:alpha/beta fold hydrolase n=1 Tax=Francisella halioticida TaxID=549298 RepID=UPI001AFC3F50|nr:alpha/beta hydrolase [Francisella halioticida]BCD91216.1 hypothetical protein fh0823_13550 [Francisella halioticida]